MSPSPGPKKELDLAVWAVPQSMTLHTTRAFMMLHSSSHTVPHWLLCIISTLPEQRLVPLTSLICDTSKDKWNYAIWLRKKKWTANWLLQRFCTWTWKGNSFTFPRVFLEIALSDGAHIANASTCKTSPTAFTIVRAFLNFLWSPTSNLRTYHLSLFNGPRVTANRAPIAVIENFQSARAPVSPINQSNSIWNIRNLKET